MVVLLPHSTEILKLTQLQKLLIKINFSREHLILRELPLKIDFPLTEAFSAEPSEKELKEIANKITSVKLLPLCQDKNSVYCPAEITYQDKVIKSQLKLLKSDAPLKKISTEEINFPLCLKIFKVCDYKKLSSSSSAINSFVWKKIN